MDIQQAQLCEDTVNANKVKDLVLKTLLNNKVISEDIALSYAENWQIIIIKNNWFESWCKKFNKTKDVWSYKYLKFED